MKKILILLLTAFAVASCNDDCDHGFDNGQINSDILVGSWYEETQNEEDTYSPSSAFYGKYCNQFQQGEGQGTYILDPERNRMKWSYQINGMHMTNDWKLRDISKYQFVQYSDIGICTYGKIVETHDMDGGDTQKIAFNELNVLGYESINENIATVSSDGIITATGEKGTAYIKIKTAEANVYAKVIVGANVPDLWIDYSCLLGRNYDDMKELLGPPSINSKDIINGEEIDNYSYNTHFHNILKGVSVAISQTTHKIIQIALSINDGVPQDVVMSYLKNHYYQQTDESAGEYSFSSSSDSEESRAVYVYYPTSKLVGIFPSFEEYDKQMGLAIWPRFNRFFGLNKAQVKRVAESKGWKYNKASDAISFNGSEIYTFEGYDFTDAIEVVYNTEDVVSQCFLQVPMSQLSYIWELTKGYTLEEAESTKKMVYYNPDKTLKVEYHPTSNFYYKLSFTDLRQKAVDRVILGNFWKGLGMTKQQVIDTFGNPYVSDTDEGIDFMKYLIYDDFIIVTEFSFDKSTGNVNQIYMELQDTADDNEVIAYLNRLYYFSENEQTLQGPRMRWLNTEKKENATLRATYYPDYNVMLYSKPE